jgi:hypothetical protein
LAEFKGYMSLLTESKLPNIVIVMVANELRKENRVMNGTTTIVTEALRTVHNRIRMSTTGEAAIWLGRGRCGQSGSKGRLM